MNLGDKVYAVGRGNFQPMGYEITAISINNQVRLKSLDNPLFPQFYSDTEDLSTNLEKIKIQALLAYNAKLNATMKRYRVTPL